MRLGVIALVAIGISQLIAGFVGISHELGPGWAIVAVGAVFAFRLMLPFTVGAFFGAWHVWGWPWPLALLLAVPGLALLIPAVGRAALAVFKRA